METRDSMEFRAAASAGYRRRRATFLERVSTIMSSLVLFVGATQFASLFGEATLFAKAAALVIVGLGIIQIVAQVDRRAMEHRFWLKAWNNMLAEIRQSIDPPRSRSPIGFGASTNSKATASPRCARLPTIVSIAPPMNWAERSPLTR